MSERVAGAANVIAAANPMFLVHCCALEIPEVVGALVEKTWQRSVIDQELMAKQMLPLSIKHGPP
jgi:hypothetical protein